MTEEQIAKLRAKYVELQFGKGYSPSWRGAFQEATWLLDEAATEARELENNRRINSLIDSAEIYTEQCPRCRGDGHEPGFGHSVAPAAASPCKRCKGSGEVQWRICSYCEGFDPVGCIECQGAVRVDL